MYIIRFILFFFMLLFFPLICDCQSSLDSWWNYRIQVANVTQIATCLQQKKMTWKINEYKKVHNTTSVKSSILSSSELFQNKMGAWNNFVTYDFKIYLTIFFWLWSLNIYAFGSSSCKLIISRNLLVLYYYSRPWSTVFMNLVWWFLNQQRDSLSLEPNERQWN